MKRCGALLSVLLVGALSGAVALAQGPDEGLDTTFGVGGRVTTVPPSPSTPSAVGQQSTGKVIVAGTSGNDFSLVRYNIDGALDTSFGSGGQVVTSIGPQNDIAHAMAIHSDNKILLAGRTFDQALNGWHFALVRYSAEGLLDATFGNGGVVTTAAGPASHVTGARSIVISPDGTLLTAGVAANEGTLMRYLPDGTLDTSFGTNGVVFAMAGDRTWFFDAVNDAQGRVLAAGSIWPNGGSRTEFLVMRFLANGAVDTSFGIGGVATVSVSPTSDYPAAMTLQPDGKILVTGISELDADTTARYPFVVVRFTADGVADPGFGTDGVVVTSFGHLYDSAIEVVALDGGKVLVGGTADSGLNGGNGDFGVVRYLNDGTLDPSFGVGGRLTTAIEGPWVDARAMHVQADGKSILAGTNGDPVMVRYQSYGGSLPQPSVPEPVVNQPVIFPPEEPAPSVPAPRTEPTVGATTDPGLPPGGVEVLVDGQTQTAQMRLDDTGALVISGEGYRVDLLGRCALTCAVNTTADGGQILDLETTGAVTLGGEGYEPGTALAVWLFSTPTLLGETVVDADGNFSLTATLEGIAPGAHTLQINGIAPDGSLRTLNLGVRVNPEQVVPAELPATGSDPYAALIAFGLIVAGLIAAGIGVTELGRSGPELKDRRRTAQHR